MALRVHDRRSALYLTISDLEVQDDAPVREVQTTCKPGSSDRT